MQEHPRRADGSDPVHAVPGSPAPKPRRRWGCLARLGCGLLAFMIGAVLMVIFLGPPLIGRWVGREAEKTFEAEYEGRLAVSDVRLDWFKRQGVGEATLTGPDGARVARVQIDLPSIVDLGRAMAKINAREPAELGLLHVQLDADLVVDDDGTTNLDRALAPRKDRSERRVEVEESGDRLEDIVPYVNAEVLVTSQRISVSTPETRAGGVELALLDLDARLILAAGEPVQLTATARSSGGGNLRIEGRLENVHTTASGGAGAEAGRLEIVVDDLSTELLGVLSGQGPDVVSLVGPAADARLLVDYRAGAPNRANVDITGANGRVQLLLVEQDGVLQLDPEVANGVTLAAPASWIEARLAPMLPPGIELAATGEVLDVELALLALSLPVPEELTADAFDPAQATFSARATIGGVQLRYTPQPGESEAAQPTSRPPISRVIEQSVRGLVVELDHDPERGLVANLRSDLEPQGRLAADARLDGAGVRALLAGEAAAGLRIEATAQAFPTTIVDALAQQDGLLLDVLGPTLDAAVQVSEVRLAAPSDDPEASPLESARLVARLRSEAGEVEFDGELVGNRLVAKGEQGLRATAMLSPLLSERIIGPLVPLLVALEKPADAAPLRITVSELSLPLDADPRGIDALVSLQLGEIRAQLLPSLGSMLSGVRELQPGIHSLLPFEVRVQNGVASYTALPIVIDGKRVDLAGTFSLVDGGMNLSTELPLRFLGGEVREALRSVEQYVPQDFAVPVSLIGSLSKPRLRVPDSFVQDLVRNAARQGIQGELERGAREGLKDILDKLKKRDG